MAAFPIFDLEIEMVSQMKGDIREIWSQYWEDDECEWDESFTFDMYEEDEEGENSEITNGIDLLNSGLSKSEALAVISKIEGPCDEYERLMKDLDYFDSFGAFLNYAKLAYNAKTYLALTLIEVEDGEEVDDPSGEGESSEMKNGLGEYEHSENHIVMDKGKLEDVEVSWDSSSPVFSPEMVSSPFEPIFAMMPDKNDKVSFPGDGAFSPRFGDCYLLNGRLVHRPAGDAGLYVGQIVSTKEEKAGVEELKGTQPLWQDTRLGISGHPPSSVSGRMPEGTQVIPHPNEIRWGGFNGPGLL